MSEAELIDTHTKTLKLSKFFYDGLLDSIDYLQKDEDKVNVLMKVDKWAKQTLKSEHMVNDLTNVVQPLRDHLHEEKDTESVITQLKKEYESAQESYKDDRKLQEMYDADEQISRIQEIIQLIRDEEDGDSMGDEGTNNEPEKDEDIEMTQSTLNLIDPISKQMIVNPVRHVPCGHVYDKESFFQLYKQKKRTGLRCPHMGCSYRRPINPLDLEEALDYQREIKKRKRLGTYGS